MRSQQDRPGYTGEKLRSRPGEKPIPKARSSDVWKRIKTHWLRLVFQPNCFDVNRERLDRVSPRKPDGRQREEKNRQRGEIAQGCANRTYESIGPIHRWWSDARGPPDSKSDGLQKLAKIVFGVSGPHVTAAF